MLTRGLAIKPHNRSLYLASLFVGSLFFGSAAHAIDNSSRYQVHARMGLLNGTYAGAGVEQRQFSVPTTMDLELEVFTDRDESFNLRSMMAMELGTNRVHYTYAGFGRSYYLYGRGKKDLRVEKLVSVQTIPKTRYYWGWNAGIAQVLVIPYGLVLASYSTTLDLSLSAGVIRQISNNVGVEFRGGLGLGYGFSAVTVTGVTMQAMLGITYFM